MGVAVPRPAIVSKPIPFPAHRKAETAAYAKRHYGIDSWRLVRPRERVTPVLGLLDLVFLVATCGRDGVHDRRLVVDDENPARGCRIHASKSDAQRAVGRL